MRKHAQNLDLPLTGVVVLVFLLMIGAVADKAWSPFVAPETNTVSPEPRVVVTPAPYQPIAPQVVIEKVPGKRTSSPGTEVRYAPIPESLEVRKVKIVQQRQAARERARSRPQQSPPPRPESKPDRDPGSKDRESLVKVCLTDICVEASGTNTLLGLGR